VVLHSGSGQQHTPNATAHPAHTHTELFWIKLTAGETNIIPKEKVLLSLYGTLYIFRITNIPWTVKFVRMPLSCGMSHKTYKYELKNQ
jgi:hypothetical protein